MNPTRKLYLVAFSALGLVLILIASFFKELAVSDNEIVTTAENSRSSSIQGESNEISLRENHSANSSLSDTSSGTSSMRQMLSEVQLRLKEFQTDEALNELNAALDEYESLSDEDKGAVLIGYATFFTRQSQFDDAVFFYEAALDLPGLRQDNRLAILQLLARFALRYEEWDQFLAYNDQYFASGGEYNWIVAGQLLRAYQSLGDADSQGRTLLLHLETGIDPRFEGSEPEYYERFGDIHTIPLSMPDKGAALELARNLVSKFDEIKNWKVLADILAAKGDESGLQQVLRDANDRGFIDVDGEWRESSSSRRRRITRT